MTSYDRDYLRAPDYDESDNDYCVICGAYVMFPPRKINLDFEGSRFSHIEEIVCEDCYQQLRDGETVEGFSEQELKL